ncbi:MAG: glycosyltransferase family 4 protein, partial [Granulosicoccus sp.]
MRIAYDHQIFSMQPWGGISRYFVRLAEELNAVGEDVSVMAHYHRNHHLEEVQKSLLKGTSVTAWPHRLGRLAKKLNAPLISRSLRQWPPDIFHETYYQGRARSTLKAPIVITVHDMIHEVMPEAFRTNDQTSARKREAVSRADHVICISENTRQDLLQFFDIPLSKTSVVHHGIDRPVQAITNQHPVPENSQPPFVLYVGKRGGYKNFQLILRAFAESSVLRGDFDIVCLGGGAFNAEELSLAASLGLSESQLRYESGDDEKLSRLYSNASVFVHSSKYEGFGLP